MEKILEKILVELQGLHQGQARIETMQMQQGQDISALKKEVTEIRSDLQNVREDVSEIKSELRYVWEDVKKIDNRLSAQDEQLAILKRLK